MLDQITLELKLPKTISLNQLYAGKHWTFRKKIKDEYAKIILQELEGYDHCRCEEFTIAIRYNSRLDVDNNVLVSKFVADTLVKHGWCADDSPRYYRKLSILFDPSLEKNVCMVRVEMNNCTMTEQ